MNTIVPYAIWAAIIILGLGLVAMLLFGIKSIVQGKVNLLTASIILLPIVVLAVLGLVLGDWAVAGMWTILLMFALAIVGLLLSGIRGLFA